MNTLDLDQLSSVTGGFKVETRRATPAQLETFNRCITAAQQKSAFRPSTWGSPKAATCFKNVIDAVRTNDPV
jgi:hypothetical protein